jgi:hypothetical protein
VDVLSAGVLADSPRSSAARALAHERRLAHGPFLPQ